MSAGQHSLAGDDPVCPDHAGAAGVRYNTPTGQPCPRSVRPDGSVAGDGACHECGLGPACPLRDPWADGILD